MEPLVSIIIPSYNNQTKLKDCCISIKNQTFKNYEVWIIDNNSTDGTLNYIKSLKKPFYWVQEPDKGIYDAMNKGITYAKGKWLYFLGADDKFFSTTVLEAIFKQKFSDRFDIVMGNIQYELKKKDKVYAHNKEGLVKASWSYKLWIKNVAHHQATFYKKELFNNLKYSLKYPILADHALNLALYKKRVKVKELDQIIALCGTEGRSKNYHWNMYREEVNLKTASSSIIYKPIFLMIGILKFLFKKLS